MAAVAFYTAPYEAVSRVLILPAGMAAMLFPAFSALASAAEPTQGSLLLARATRYMLMLVAAPTALIILFARDLLAVWLGPVYAAEGALALQILAVGVFVNSFAQLPYSYLQGMGRPDLTAKFHVAELASYAVLAWILVDAFGVTGAALAWTIRVSADAALLVAGVWRVLRVRPSAVVTQICGPGADPFNGVVVRGVVHQHHRLRPGICLGQRVEAGDGIGMIVPVQHHDGDAAIRRTG